MEFPRDYVRAIDKYTSIQVDEYTSGQVGGVVFTWFPSRRGLHFRR